jgi:hypothetical protein
MLTLALMTWLSAGPTMLSLEVKPAGTLVKVDGKKVGVSQEDKPISVKVTPGKHVIRCEYKGDATTDETVVKAGEKKTWKWEFTGMEKEKKPEAEPAPTPESPPPSNP